MTLKLGMQHCLCEYYQGCSNYDPGLTLTHFTSRSNLGKSENYHFLETIGNPFYAKVKFGHIHFCLEKVKIIYFLETIAALGLRVA